MSTEVADNDGHDRFAWLERSPVKAIHRERKAYIGKDDSDDKVDFCKMCIKGWIQKCQTFDCIDQKHAQRAPNCSCLEDVNFTDAELAESVDYIFGFALLSRPEQQTILIEWIKYGQNIGRQFLRGQPGRRMTYLLPGTSHLICKDGLCVLLGLGTTAWDSVMKMVKENRTPEHGLTGKVGNRQDEVSTAMMREFFEELQQQAVPRATLIVRGLVRAASVDTTLRDEDGNLLDLPSYMTKRGLFNALLAENGQVYQYDN